VEDGGWIAELVCAKQGEAAAMIASAQKQIRFIIFSVGKSRMAGFVGTAASGNKTFFLKE
jgi:hypothetical protein